MDGGPTQQTQVSRQSQMCTISVETELFWGESKLGPGKLLRETKLKLLPNLPSPMYASSLHWCLGCVSLSSR